MLLVVDKQRKLKQILKQENMFQHAREDILKYKNSHMIARDYFAAVELIKKHKPTIIIIDWDLGFGLNGKNVLEFIQEYYKQCPKIVLTKSFTNGIMDKQNK